MRSSLLFAILSIFTLSLYALDREGGNVNPKAINYREVLKEIKYPQICRENGIEGTVIVELKIDRKGEVRSYKFISSPCKDLNMAVENELSKLIFEPAVNKHGRAVEGKIKLPVHFKLSI